MKSNVLTAIVFKIILLIVCASLAGCSGPFAVVAGRRDKELIVVDLQQALEAKNSGTANAVSARVPVGSLPSAVLAGPDGRTAYVVNHAGAADQDAINRAEKPLFQHGHRGSVTIVDISKAAPTPSRAVAATVDTGGFGPVGIALSADRKRLFVANSEGDLGVSGNTPATEFGGHTVAILDHEQAMKNPKAAVLGTIDLGTTPDSKTGCLSNPNAIALSPDEKFLFVAEGGGRSVAVVDVIARSVVHRVEVGEGPWGMALLPKGETLVVSNRERCPAGEKDPEGHTISFISVAKAIAKDPKAEMRRMMVGSNDPAKPSRPFGLAASPDGRWLAVANFRTNDISLVDVDKTLAGQTGAEAARVPLKRPDGQAARPRGVAFTPDGKHIVATGGPIIRAADKNIVPRSGTMWIIEAGLALTDPAKAVVATVSGVGNEPYLVDIVK
ncbi:MAG TPA: YncE family protein [Candidatus Binatia bacterium]|jgi:DNA-binding beta-propeller fold protein YncE